MSDRIEAFFDDSQGPEHIEAKANQEANFFEYKLMLEILQLNKVVGNIENNLVSYSYFSNSPRS